MKTIKNINRIIFITFALFASCCKSTQPLEQKTVDLPESFSGSKDSLNSATINWKEYFSDATLISLIDTALRNNQDVSVALQRIEATKAGVRFAKGASLPMISGGGTTAIRRFGLYTMDGSGNATTEIYNGELVPVNLPDYFVGLQTAWEVDIWGKLRNRKKSAIARYLGSIEGKNWVVSNLVAEVAMSYYELLAFDQELDILRETISLQENALSIATIQKEAGAANELAVKQFRTQLLNSRSLEVDVLQMITELENRINALLGRFPQPLARDKSMFTSAVPRQVNAGIPSGLLRNRPDIKQAELELVASKADVKAARALFYPSLTITGGAGFQAYKTSLLFTSPESFAFSAIGSLAAPLINRSAIHAEFQSANAYQREALYSYEKSIVNGFQEVSNELSNINNLQQKYTFKREEVDVLTESIETSSELFRTGRANYLEVIVTQQNALQARLELIDVRKQQFNATVNLYKALGGGWR
jgi:outer membrane protein, multidrug efflux system